jgi:hypothetical protein
MNLRRNQLPTINGEAEYRLPTTNYQLLTDNNRQIILWKSMEVQLP